MSTSFHITCLNNKSFLKQIIKDFEHFTLLANLTTQSKPNTVMYCKNVSIDQFSFSFLVATLRLFNPHKLLMPF